METDLRSHPAYGEQMAKYFRLSKAPSVVILRRVSRPSRLRD